MVKLLANRSDLVWCLFFVSLGIFTLATGSFFGALLDIIEGILLILLGLSMLIPRKENLIYQVIVCFLILITTIVAYYFKATSVFTKQTTISFVLSVDSLISLFSVIFFIWWIKYNLEIMRKNKFLAK